MPLPESSRLDIEVRGRRAERRLAVIVTLAGGALPWLVLDAGPSVAAGMLLALGLAAGFHRAGWLGGARRIERMVWASDGLWLLIDAAGHGREASLAADTRVGLGCVWLRWQVPGANSMLLLAGDVPPGQLRRLLVRLRMDRQEPAAVPRAAAI